MRVLLCYLLVLFAILSIHCKPEEDSPTGGTTTPSLPTTQVYESIPKYIWPLATAQNDQSILINYFDANGAAAGFMDFECGAVHGYDGHLGIDIAIFNFRAMDEGIAVVAAAPGIVSALEVNKYDRVYWTPYTDSGNFVSIRYPDGSYTVYYHLKKNSVTVKVGEQVERGQVIGFVGSSGATPFPHLHLETKVANGAGGFTSVDPFAGRCNDIESIWEVQPDYIANQRLQILDAGVFADFEYNGEYQYNEIKTLKDRPKAPAVIGKDLGRIGFWVQFQGSVGHQYDVRISKPDGTVFIEEHKTLAQKRRYGWHGMNWSMADITEADFGPWKAEILRNGTLEKEVSFEVGETTEFGPRFYPLAGTSAIIGQGESVRELTWIGDEQDLTLSLDDESSGVRLNGNQLVIPAASNQAYRNHWVKVTAIDSKGRSDYYTLHLIDLSKPFKQ